MDARSVWRILRFNWILILVLALLGAAGGTALALRMTPRYTAEAQLIVTVTSGATTGELAQGSNYSQQQARNYAAVATREIVLRPVIEELGLDTDVTDLRQVVKASVPLNTSIVSVKVDQEDPQTAARIANAVARSLAAAASQLAPRVDDVKGSPVKLVVIEQATPPVVASSPNKPMFLLSGLLIGLLAALLVLVIRELLGARVRTLEQVTSLVPAHLLGSVTLPKDPDRTPVAVVGDPNSSTAEDFRQLRTTLRFIQNDVDHKAIVVTSARSGEGKSTVAANLAATIAASGRRVCLVEGDLRRPGLADLLGLTTGAGLATLLAGEAEAGDVLQPWGPDGMQVLVAGETPPNPSELLESQRAVTVLEDLRRRFDVTIIDSPPINGIADSSILSRMMGGALLVVGSRRVQERELRAAVDQLQTIEVPILGVVFNQGRATGRTRHAYAPLHTDEPDHRPAGATSSELTKSR